MFNSLKNLFKPKVSDLEEEQATASMMSIRQPVSPSVMTNLTPLKLANILNAADQGNMNEFLTLAMELEDRGDMHFASVLSTRKLAISGLDFQVKAASDESQDQKLADFVREISATPHFSSLIGDLTDALSKGYAVCEIMWDKGERWTPRDFIYRDPRFFTYDYDTKSALRLIDAADPINGVELAPYKFIIHQPNLRQGLPCRAGLARLALVGYLCKAWAWKDWMAFADIFGLPMRLGKYHQGASKDEISKLKMAVMAIGSDAAGVIPESMSIEFPQIQNPQGAADFFEKLVKFWNSELSKLILGQTMTSDNGSSQAQAKVHNEVRLDILKNDAKALNRTINEYLIKPLIDLNFGVQRVYPQFALVVPEPEDLLLLITAMEKLVPLGLEVEQSVIRDKLGLPDPIAGALLLKAPAAQQALHNKGLQPLVGDHPLAANSEILNNKGLQPLVGGASELQPLVGGDQALHDHLDQHPPQLPAAWLDKIMQAISQDPESALPQLAELYPELDDSALMDELTKLIMISEVWGRLCSQAKT